ncbi:MAG: hypothetical protein JW909_07375 [Planctomycetes bacterium]|nr:hypothetical protein [Planctomycetota bacterium]
MPVTVYTDPNCNASLKACYRLRQMGIKFRELPMPADEMGLVRMLWQAGSCLPVVRIGDGEYHDYPSGVRRLAVLEGKRKTAAQED